MGLFRKRQKITIEELCVLVFTIINEEIGKTGARWAEQGFLTSNPKTIDAFRFLGKRAEEFSIEKGNILILPIPSPSSIGFPEKKVSDIILEAEFFKVLTELYVFYLFLFDMIVQKEFGLHAAGALRDCLLALHHSSGGWSKDEADNLVDFMEERWEDYAKAFAAGALMSIGSFAASCIIGSEAKTNPLLVAFFATQAVSVLKVYGNMGKDYELVLA